MNEVVGNIIYNIADLANLSRIWMCVGQVKCQVTKNKNSVLSVWNFRLPMHPHTCVYNPVAPLKIKQIIFIAIKSLSSLSHHPHLNDAAFTDDKPSQFNLRWC